VFHGNEDAATVVPLDYRSDRDDDFEWDVVEYATLTFGFLLLILIMRNVFYHSTL
jgi:hypothetical protein